MGYIIIFVLWLVFCWVAGSIAEKRGRSFYGFFIVSLFISPLMGILIALLLGETEKHKIGRIECEERMRAEVRRKLDQE